jgi:hypothetical protein
MMVFLLAGVLAAGDLKIATLQQRTQEANRNIMNRHAAKKFFRPNFGQLDTSQMPLELPE